jgi:hypothetical protein
LKGITRLRVLFDKSVPYGARHFLSEHHVETVDEHGWERISNGELLNTAEGAGFQVVVTADQNIIYQQNLEGRKIALVVFGSNIWPIVRKHAKSIKERVDGALPGSYTFIEMPLPPKRNATHSL